ncbi:MAG: cysteine desulfurase [Candidatus Marinimicrobia bacterium]|nr:cysteine desulfurase [Candidatus Neomarinimicrobiota bacterium]
MIFDVNSIRQDFPNLHQTVNGKPLVYLDNAASTHKPQSVIEAVRKFYSEYNANVHRALYRYATEATEAYEASRDKVARLINAPDRRSIIFTSGTTESINLIAYAWGRHNLGPGDEILVTEMEHHSNLIPWQLTARDTGATLKFIPITADGALDLSNPDQYFTARTKLVAFIQQSNVFGTINPAKQIIEMAHQVGALTIVDAAQSVPHHQVDMTELDCDFLAFSGHKMLGPTGIGVLYGKPELLEAMEPFLGGGEMIQSVTMEKSTWNEIPWKFEAGTPKIAQVIGLGTAIDYITAIGFEAIVKYEKELTDYALSALSALEGITIHGNAHQRGPVISFNVKDVHPHDLAQFLDQEGIAIRAGHHCTQPIMQKLGVPATSRASFSLYNTKAEIDILIESIANTIRFMTG